MSEEEIIDEYIATPTENKPAPKGISSLMSLGKLSATKEKEEERTSYEGEDYELTLIVKDEKETLVMKNTKEIQDIKVYVEKKYQVRKANPYLR
jgi:thiamine monophosphate kinase